jgi:hypothetical protein
MHELGSIDVMRLDRTPVAKIAALYVFLDSIPS